jgi:two-component system, LytTR family, sensor kinase
MQRRLLLHISFWLAYLLVKTSQNIGSDLGGSPGSLEFNVLKVLFLAQLALLIVKVPMVYTLFYIFEKYLAKEWSVAKTILATVALFLLSLAAFFPVKQFIVLGGIYKIKAPLSAAFNFSSILSSLLILFFVCSIALAIKLVRSNIRQKEAAQEITKKKLETELRFLKAQTNPHFLFNTLNNIYALARKRSEATADVVMKLSKLLRFMLYESQKQTIRIADEIQVLEDYIELEKIRYNDRLKITFTRSVDDELQTIAPLILLPFVENAFKHGASESRFSSYININLELRQGQLHFSCENSRSTETAGTDTDKIGLGNIRRQLELIYPDHTLAIANENDYFKVLLKLNLNTHAAM